MIRSLCLWGRVGLVGGGEFAHESLVSQLEDERSISVASSVAAWLGVVRRIWGG